jgi:hypothetical protein
VGRKLRVYDSFQGLPLPVPADREGKGYTQGQYRGTLNEVRRNIQHWGAIESCEFVAGWFEDTLPTISGPILLAWIDVDLEASLHTCVKHIWPHLVDEGFIFTDECVRLDYVSLFWSEKWWKKYFDRTSPGLIGAGTGLGLGNYYVGPWSERDDHPLQQAGTCAYTRKSFSGYWSYYPDE